MDDTPARVLVVDDNDLIRNLVYLILTSGGYRTDVAAGYADARRLASTRRYHAYVVDIRLGDGTGTGLVDALRPADPDVDGRCLLLSGWRGDQAPDGIPVLHKPFGAAELTAAVRALAVGGGPAC